MLEAFIIFQANAQHLKNIFKCNSQNKPCCYYFHYPQVQVNLTRKSSKCFQCATTIKGEPAHRQSKQTLESIVLKSPQLPQKTQLYSLFRE